MVWIAASGPEGEADRSRSVFPSNRTLRTVTGNVVGVAPSEVPTKQGGSGAAALGHQGEHWI